MFQWTVDEFKKIYGLYLSSFVLTFLRAIERKKHCYELFISAPLTVGRLSCENNADVFNPFCELRF